MNRLTVFLLASSAEILKQNVAEFNQSGLVNKIIAISPEQAGSTMPSGFDSIAVRALMSTETIKLIALRSETPFTVIYTKPFSVRLGAHSLYRLIQVAESTKAGMVYSDYYELKENNITPHPLIEYQEGSLRDDFNFGSLLLFDTAALKESVSRMNQDYSIAGMYDLRLKLSQKYEILHIPEFLYSEVETDVRNSEEKQFDYVNPRNREVQIEMERACTEHLKDTGAWLEPRFRQLSFDEHEFKNEISVIIPVKNRVKTIPDAIRSVLSQKAPFDFNLIIVDNHSSDGTSDAIREFGKEDSRIVHVIPERTDLGIGGCWNEAVYHAECGKFAVQLDSDDLYIDDKVLEKIADAFYEQKCAMLIGSYRIVNFNLEEIPPGIVDHREWTPDNGRNNALRINGLGAPRAFYTPVIRTVRFPNVSYGEDYAVGLAISRYYNLGRIYDPLYLCRRWEGNSDAALDIQKLNAYNFYKDKIRTVEFKARQQYVREGQ